MFAMFEAEDVLITPRWFMEVNGMLLSYSFKNEVSSSSSMEEERANFTSFVFSGTNFTSFLVP